MAETLLLVLSVVLAWLVWMTIRSFSEEHRWLAELPHEVGDDEIGEIGPYELAYLAGGARRTVHTALAVLLQAGRIRISNTGRVTAVADADLPAAPIAEPAGGPIIEPSGGLIIEPVERAVMEVLDRAGSCSADDLVRLVAAGPEAARVRAELARQGLLIPEGAQPHIRRTLDRIRIFSIAAIAGCVVTLALVVAGVAAFEVRTIGAIVIAAAAGAIGWLNHPTYQQEVRSLPFVLLTEQGRHLLSSAQRQHGTPPKGPSKLVAAATAFAVAVNGLRGGGDPRLSLLSDSDGDRASGSGSSSGSAHDGGYSCSSSASSCSSGGGSSCSSGGGSF
ncbi:TIGR04222 domain-containing membrane protein [Nonomuraea polychroma]|nr:TIGR04222 domain-containing membrane protein [Nonomuraea polychroma]